MKLSTFYYTLGVLLAITLSSLGILIDRDLPDGTYIALQHPDDPSQHIVKRWGPNHLPSKPEVTAQEVKNAKEELLPCLGEMEGLRKEMEKSGKAQKKVEEDAEKLALARFQATAQFGAAGKDASERHVDDGSHKNAKRADGFSLHLRRQTDEERRILQRAEEQARNIERICDKVRENIAREQREEEEKAKQEEEAKKEEGKNKHEKRAPYGEFTWADIKAHGKWKHNVDRLQEELHEARIEGEEKVAEAEKDSRVVMEKAREEAKKLIGNAVDDAERRVEEAEERLGKERERPGRESQERNKRLREQREKEEKKMKEKAEKEKEKLEKQKEEEEKKTDKWEKVKRSFGFLNPGVKTPNRALPWLTDDDDKEDDKETSKENSKEANKENNKPAEKEDTTEVLQLSPTPLQPRHVNVVTGKHFTTNITLTENPDLPKPKHFCWEGHIYTRDDFEASIRELFVDTLYWVPPNFAKFSIYNGVVTFICNLSYDWNVASFVEFMAAMDILDGECGATTGGKVSIAKWNKQMGREVRGEKICQWETTKGGLENDALVAAKRWGCNKYVNGIIRFLGGEMRCNGQSGSHVWKEMEEKYPWFFDKHPDELVPQEGKEETEETDDDEETEDIDKRDIAELMKRPGRPGSFFLTKTKRDQLRPTEAS